MATRTLDVTPKSCGTLTPTTAFTVTRDRVSTTRKRPRRVGASGLAFFDATSREVTLRQLSAARLSREAACRFEALLPGQVLVRQ